MPKEYKFDVFISYSSKDRNIVLPIAERLKSDHLRVWFDKWQILPGAHISMKIDEGLNTSRRLVFFMSANAFGSDWTKLESSAYRFRDPLNKDLAFLPVRLDETPIEGTLAQFEYIDFVQDSEKGYATLLEACRQNTGDVSPNPTEVPAPDEARGRFLGEIGPVARRTWSTKVSVRSIVIALVLLILIGAAVAWRLSSAEKPKEDPKSVTVIPETAPKVENSPPAKPDSVLKPSQPTEDPCKPGGNAVTAGRADVIVDDCGTEIRFGPPHNLPYPYFLFNNIGDRIATDVVVWYDYKFRDRLSGSFLATEMKTLSSHFPLDPIPGKVVDPNRPRFDLKGRVKYKNHISASFTPEAWNAGQISLYVWGRICYRNANPNDRRGTGHVANFCLRSDRPDNKQLIGCEDEIGNDEADGSYDEVCKSKP
jgi:hypothetical protein